MNHASLRNNLRRRSGLWCFILLLLCLAPVAGGGQAASPDAASSRVIRVVMDSNYPPYAYVDEKGGIQGILADQWRLWQEKTGIRVELAALDWKDALVGMQVGRFDVIDTAFMTEERQGWLEFGKPYAKVEVSAFFHKNINKVSDVHSLQGFIVGVKEGDAAVELLRRKGIDSLMLFKGYEAMVIAAKEHKVNVFVADKPPIIYYLYKHGIRSDFKVSAPLDIGESHRAVKKGNGGILREVEAGFAQISAEELERIDKKWSDQPLPPVLQVVPLLIGAGILVLVIAGLSYWNWTLRAVVKRRTIEQEHSERVLRESEARYHELVENANVIILHIDRDGQILFLNEFAQKFFGYTLDEVAGRSLVGTIVPYNLPGRRLWECLANQSEQPGDHAVNENENMRRDGTRVWIDWTCKALRDPEGNVSEILCVGSDSTDRKLAEEALRREREHLAFMIEGSRIGTWEWNVQTNAIRLNGNWTRMLGYTLAELMPLTIDIWKKRIHPDDLQQVDESLLRCARDEAVDHDCEYRIRHKDGHWLWILDRGRVVTRTAAGRPLEMIGMHADITIRKQVEEKLIATNELLTQFIKNSPIYAFIREVTPTGSRFLKASDNYQDIFGLPVSEAIGKTMSELFSAEQAAKTAEEDWQVISRGMILRRREEEYKGRIYAVIKFPISLGERILLAGYVIDVTECRQAQAALQASETTFRNIVQASPMGIHIYDLLPDGRLVFVEANPAADRLLGLKHARLVGKALEDFFPAFRGTGLPPSFRRVAQLGESWQTERFEYDDGVIAGVFELYAFQMSTGRVAIQFNEISAHKRAEEEKNQLEAQLTQARKMESIGQLAGGVAHDFNNMLSVIIGHCELGLNGLNAAHPLYATLQHIRRAAERSADLTRQLLAFARKQPVTPEDLDLNATVAQMLTMLQRVVGEDIELTWLPSQNAGWVRIDPSQVDQILVNLFANARDAIGDTGKITIETAVVTLDARYCAKYADMEPGDYVQLAVSDNGCGMSHETRTRLFEPFYTTKDLGKGTGLGLATVYGIVRQNNGFINVYSEPGYGSTFKIFLPRLADHEDQEAVAEPVPPVASGRETILLVEDETMILEITAAMLCKLGYTVLTAPEPEVAMRLAEEHGGAIDLLLTDVVMPGMNGRMLANNLSAANPKLKCLFMSGYTANVIAHHGVLDEGVHFIHKPFAFNELAAKIREALEEQ